MQRVLPATLVFLCFVLPAAAAPADKVTICHHDGKDRPREITISVNALAAHQKHGDTLPGTFFLDQDQDQFGSVAAGSGCEAPPGTVLVGGDCDDTNPAVNPGAPEVCNNGIDDNCNGEIDENCVGCVDILDDCNPLSGITRTICGAGPHVLDDQTRRAGSYIRFIDATGAILQSCDPTVAPAPVTTDTDFCRNLPPGFNDNVCIITLF